MSATARQVLTNGDCPHLQDRQGGDNGICSAPEERTHPFLQDRQGVRLPGPNSTIVHTCYPINRQGARLFSQVRSDWGAHAARPPRHSGAASPGMTFIELLVAVALSALIIAVASMLTYSLTSTWGSLQMRPQFEQHVQGVTSTIEALFERTDTLSGSDNRPFGWSIPPEGSARTFAFRLSDPIPIFIQPYGPQGRVNAWLDFDPERKRLWLIWYPDPRLTENRRKLQYTLLSDQIEDIELGYHDTGSNIWEFESMSQAARPNADKSPLRMRITFAPDGNSAMPIYRTINPERPMRGKLKF